MLRTLSANASSSQMSASEAPRGSTRRRSTRGLPQAMAGLIFRDIAPEQPHQALPGAERPALQAEGRTVAPEPFSGVRPSSALSPIGLAPPPEKAEAQLLHSGPPRSGRTIA